MANTEQNPALLSESHSKVELESDGAHAQRRVATSSATGDLNSRSETPPQLPTQVMAQDSSSPDPSLVDSRPATASTRPTLVQLGTGSLQSLTHHPPRKFNAVNINKKFLEKTSAAAAAMATASSTSATNKPGSSISRPQVQTTQSHSRLVTAKLTGSPAPSTTAGPGWSRPTSTAPSSTGTNSPIGSSPLPSAAVALSTGSVVPQPPHAGKVIQPQSRVAMLQTTNLQKEGAKHPAKTAWGNVKPPSGPPVMTSQDFPTAAEVAQATATKKPKQDDQKSTSESVSAVKHRLEEEADTFRGVHLDPNAHHWDEMEEDNDDFLGGVIEFGDGRQYKVEATEPSSSPPPPGEPSHPVSKEDRFVDDFDRSWPKSKPSPTSSTRELASGSPALSSRGNSLHGAQDHLHPQLFNERSNRFEPYSHGPRGGQNTFQIRRGSHNESTSPTDSRKGGIQLLQKSGNGELPPRPRGLNGAPLRGGFSGPIGDRRDSGSRRDHPPSPRMTRNDWGHNDMTPSTSLQGRDRDPSERGRRSDMGPPPVPLHATRRPSQDGGRQVPPHLSPDIGVPRRLSSHERDGRFGLPPTSPQSSRFAPPSPAMSHASTLALSPGSVSVALPGGATADLNEVTRDLMQSAAARAKARKQQEEAEREAQKERAKRKAAELEEKLKAQEVEKQKKEREEVVEKEGEEKEGRDEAQEKEAVMFIESAIDGIDSPLQERRPSIDAASLPKNLPRRPSSQRGQQRRMSNDAGHGVGTGTRRPSFGLGARPPPGQDTSPASQADSWRAKVNPLSPPPPTPRHQHPRPVPSAPSAPPQPALAATPSTALDRVADIAEGSMNDLEVVDFSNLGKFIGGEEEKEAVEETGVAEPEKAEPETGQEVLSNKPRPTASDFFEDSSKTIMLPAKAENVWRRKTSGSVAETEEKAKVVVVKEENALRTSSSAPIVMATQPHSHPHPRLRPHTEASMSALDDVMSRIKGAMQASGAVSKEIRPPAGSSEIEHHHPPASTRTSYPQPSAATSKTPQHRERWQPAPTLTPSHSQQQRTRSQAEEKLEVLRESLSTSLEPTDTPPSADLTVQLPKVSHQIEPISKKQQQLFSRMPLPARFELLSFDPPVQGMNKRDFSVNSVLFRPGMGFKANRIRVFLSGSKSGHSGSARTVSIGPKYNIGSGVFGKPTNADGATSWRKTGGPGKVEDKDKEQGNDGVDHVESGDKSIPEQDAKVSEEKQQEEQAPLPSRTRQQPKMPAGSVVAFIRDSRIDAVEADPKPLVNFIVTSELDEPVGEAFYAVASSSEVRKEAAGAGSSKSVVHLVDKIREDGTDSNSKVPSPPKVPENKPADESAAIHSISAPLPTHQSTTPWGRSSLSVPIKDGAVRAPDPEHLKAVWSQPANKADLNPVNSLEGIADDLTSVPFSIQDVKSEDGETPPPALPSTTSRMSLHEVTKAFQKVPSSSPSNSSNQSRNPLSPSSNNNTPASRSPYPYSPMPLNAMRLPHSYEHYSPMLSHSPSPTVIYPHQLTSSPIPSRMPVNGHAPMYHAPVWIPPASAPSNHAAVMRPVMSPYPAHMMSYGSPNGPVYAHPMGSMPPPQQPPVGNGAGRGRGVMMSPAMTHAHAQPMYASSPVMMHMQSVPQHQNPTATYMGISTLPGGTPGRGQPRTDISQAHPSSTNNTPGQQPPHHHYNPAASYVRSTW